MADMFKSNAEKSDYEKAQKAGEAAESAVSKARLQSAEGLGSKEKKGRGTMPMQEQGESMSSYGERLRKWRQASVDSAMDKAN